MNPGKLQMLIYMRKEMLQEDSDKQKEIVTKLDELILAELNKSDTTTTTDDDIPFQGN